MAKNDKKPDEPKAFLVVKTATRGGTRRRAGRAFSDEETKIPLDSLTEAEIAAIKGDNLLHVTVEEPADKAE